MASGTVNSMPDDAGANLVAMPLVLQNGGKLGEPLGGARARVHVGVHAEVGVGGYVHVGMGVNVADGGGDGLAWVVGGEDGDGDDDAGGL